MIKWYIFFSGCLDESISITQALDDLFAANSVPIEPVVIPQAQPEPKEETQTILMPPAPSETDDDEEEEDDPYKYFDND